MKRSTALAALMLAVAAMAFAACGDDDDDDGGGGGEAETAEAATLSIEATEPKKGETRFEAPASIEAGLVEISFTNSGKAPHEGQLLRLEGGHTAQEALEAVTGESGKIPDWVIAAGGAGSAQPGETLSATQVLEPGSYGIIDTENLGSADLEVTGEASGADLPETDTTVTSSEYTFETSGLKAGANTLLFDNTGKEIHHIVANPLKPDATRQQILEYLESDGKGPNPYKGDEESGEVTAAIDAGYPQVVDLELQAGKYAFQCFIPDRAGGPPHAVKGMITVEEIQ